MLIDCCGGGLPTAMVARGLMAGSRWAGWHEFVIGFRSFRKGRAMEKDKSMFDGQRKTMTGGAKPGEARPGRPRDIGRRRFVVAGLTVGPVLATLGTTSTETFAKGSK